MDLAVGIAEGSVGNGPGGKDLVAPAERLAVVDNDGTLRAEQPA